jgi:dihydropyrimidinase
MGLLIKNGEVVTASDRFLADVRIDGGTISDIGTRLEPRTGDETIDASGRYVLPGFIDPHVHMELPFMGTVSADDFEIGGASGAAGGTTCFIDFCMQGRGEPLPVAIAGWHAKSKKSAVDYSYHMAITDFGPNTPAEMREVVETHGITSFKVFMAYKGALMVDDGQLYQIMEEAAKLGAVVTVHAENGDAVVHLHRARARSRARRPSAR